MTRVKDTHAIVGGGETSWPEVKPMDLESQRSAARVADREGRTVLLVAVPGFGLLGLVCTRQSV